MVLVKFRQNAPCSTQKWHGEKDGTANPCYLSPNASFKYEGCCKECYYDGEVISLWATSPLTAKNYSGTAPKTRLCKGSLSQFHPARWQLLVSDLQHICTAQHNVCSLWNAATSWSACVPNFPPWNCCLSNPHPIFTYTPDCSYQSLIVCICPDWTASKVTELSCQLVIPFKHSHYPEIHFLMLHKIYLRNWWKKTDECLTRRQRSLNRRLGAWKIHSPLW